MLRHVVKLQQRTALLTMASRLWTRSEMLMNGGIKVALYKSSRSKLTVAVGDVPGPMVKGLISFVTETDRDDGLPHTLEHLVFMGSKKYPYKGVLDIIANRCLASGTNAFTDQDHTGYTLNTVGSEGFLKVLPVYINHLLSPMLSCSQYMTEVHHINGNGEDAGVVYSEMQDHESEMENIMNIKLKELAYPKNNPYGVDTGGRLKNLRESCNIHSVRDFHKQFYHLSNMVVTVCGKVDHQRLLSIMEAVEEEHLANIPATFKEPFSFSLAPISESSIHRVICPSDDETVGIVNINWFGHKPDEIVTATALEIMFDYLSHTPVAPLQKDFILCPEPLASHAYFHISEQTVSMIHLQFGGVPVERIDEVRKKFLEKTFAEMSIPSNWDMERMGFLIDQSIQDQLVKTENKAADEIFGHIIGHQLYGKNNDESLKERIDQIAVMKKLRSEPAEYWADLMKKYFSLPCITVVGVPSEKMVEDIAAEEKKRLAEQKSKLGEEGIKKCGEDIAAAIKENTSNKPTKELLDEMIVKDLEKFDRFPIVTINNINPSGNNGDFNPKFMEQFPFPTYVHNIPSKFVELFAILDTADLTVEQRAWLMLYNELLFESPAMINGELKSADEVAKLYTKDLVDHSIGIGVSGHFDRLLNLRLKVSLDKYPNIAKWAEVFLKGIVFDAERIKVCAQKLASEARERKRDGSSVAHTSLCALTYDENSNSRLHNVIVLESFHESIVEKCTKNPSEVTAALEEIRKTLLAKGLNAHFLCDSRLINEKLYGPNLWTFTQDGFGTSTECFKCITGESVSADCIGKQAVSSVGGSESSFIVQSCLLDSDWLGDSLLPTMLFSQYLSQCEGPLWNGIRGVGLAYGANIYVKADRKAVSLSLYRCSQPTQAYEQTRKLVTDIIASGRVEESEFEAAKRSLVYDLMSREGTISATGKLAILGVLRGTPENFNETVCEKIWNMTSEEMIKVGGPRIANLFENFVRAIAVHPQKVNEIKSAFPGITNAPINSLLFGGSNKKTKGKRKSRAVKSKNMKKTKTD